MVKSQIISEVSKRLNLSEKEVSSVLNDFIKVMYESLIKMNEVQIDGVGKFVPVIVGPRKICSNIPGNKTYIYKDETIRIKYIVSPKLLATIKPVILSEIEIDYKEVIKNLNLE